MTEVVIQHLTADETAKIKCRDLIKKIAVYKNRLAVRKIETPSASILTANHSGLI